MGSLSETGRECRVEGGLAVGCVRARGGLAGWARKRERVRERAGAESGKRWIGILGGMGWQRRSGKIRCTLGVRVCTADGEGRHLR